MSQTELHGINVDGGGGEGMLTITYKCIDWDRMGQGLWKKRTGCKETELLGKRGDSHYAVNMPVRTQFKLRTVARTKVR